MRSHRLLTRLVQDGRAATAAADAANWQKLKAGGRYQEYLDGCGTACAYRDIARRLVSCFHTDFD
jgi:hypothetical protein